MGGATMPLTDRQRLLLVSDARTWVNIAVSTSRSIVGEPEDLMDVTHDAGGHFAPDPNAIAKILRIAVVNVHMLAVALRQIDRHLELLAPEWEGDLAKRGTHFRNLYASSEMKDLRDVLEHSADYVADRGRKPQLKQSEHAGYGVTAVNGKIEGIHVFGKTHDVFPVVAAAVDLLPVLTKD